MANKIVRTSDERGLDIVYKGTYAVSLPINPDWFKGNIEEDCRGEELSNFQVGVFVTIGEDGYAKLADGATAIAPKALVQAAQGYLWENMPTLASKKIAAIGAPCMIRTQQVVENNIKPGTPIYLGTGDKAGMCTSTKGTSTCLLGICVEGNSADDETITIELV